MCRLEIGYLCDPVLECDHAFGVAQEARFLFRRQALGPVRERLVQQIPISRARRRYLAVPLSHERYVHAEPMRVIGTKHESLWLLAALAPVERGAKLPQDLRRFHFLGNQEETPPTK